MNFGSSSLRQFARGASKTMRSYSSVASAPLKSSWGPIVAGAGVAALGAYYFYSTQAPVAAESALKGDKQWVDFKLAGVKDLTSNVCTQLSDFVFGLNRTFYALKPFFNSHLSLANNNHIFVQ